jgi:hypothetical protein
MKEREWCHSFVLIGHHIRQKSYSIIIYNIKMLWKLLRILLCTDAKYIRQYYTRHGTNMSIYKILLKNFVGSINIRERGLKRIRYDYPVQSTAHQIIHFGFWTALFPRALALISNCKCIAWRAVGRRYVSLATQLFEATESRFYYIKINVNCFVLFWFCHNNFLIPVIIILL